MPSSTCPASQHRPSPTANPAHTIMEPYRVFMCTVRVYGASLSGMSVAIASPLSSYHSHTRTFPACIASLEQLKIRVSDVPLPEPCMHCLPDIAWLPRARQPKCTPNRRDLQYHPLLTTILQLTTVSYCLCIIVFSLAPCTIICKRGTATISDIR